MSHLPRTGVPTALQLSKSDRWTSTYARSRSPTPLPSPVNLTTTNDGDVRAFASTVSPAAERAKWACACCKTAFIQDQAVFPVPKDEVDLAPDALVCETCFAERFAKGACESCGKPVLGNRPFIKHCGRFWHSVLRTLLYIDYKVCSQTHRPVSPASDAARPSPTTRQSA